MADNDVRIKLSLDGADQVQRGLAGVGDSATQADSKLGNMAKGGLIGAGKALVGFATAAAAAGGTLVAGVASQYAQYQQNVGGIETLFGDAAGRMKEYAANAYKTAGMSANEFMGQATSFAAALTGSLGEGEDAAKAANDIMVAMSDNANKMGTDIGSIQDAYQGFAKQNFTMLDNLKLGYGGTQEEMQRLLDDAEKLPGAMGQEFDLNNFADVTKAIQLIQEEMGIAGTTATEATQTISGSIGMLKGAWSNLLVGLGDADADIATLAGNVISSFEIVVSNITPVIQNIGTNIATLGPQIGSMMGSLVGAISSAIPAILEAGVAIIGGLIQGISSSLPSLITAVVPAIVSLVEVLTQQAPLLLDAGIQSIVALAQGIASALPTLIPLMVTGILSLVQVFVDNLPLLLEAGLQLITGLAQGILAAMPTLIAMLPSIIQGIVQFILSGVPMLLQAGIQLFTALVGALPTIINQIVAVLPQIITSVINAVLGSIPLIIDAGIQLITALVTALPQIIDAIVAAIPPIISAVLDAVFSNIPALVSAGVRLLTALITNLPQIIGTIVWAIPQIIGGIVGALGGSIGRIIQAGFDLLVGIVGNIGGVASRVAGAIPQVISSIVSAIGSGAGKIVKAGYDLIAGMWNGISSAGSWLYKKVMGWASGLLDGIKGFFGIKSPSRVMADEVGAMLPAGLGEGVEEGETKATESVKRMNQRVIREARKLPSLNIDQNVSQSVTSTVTPTVTPIFPTATPTGGGGPTTVTISGPLVRVDSMQVRNDQDIRRLSTQLKTDMTRELRAQGVFS